MKKAYIIMLLLLCCAVVFCGGSASANEFETTAKSACVVERTSGRVLFQKNAHLQLPMASTTKIITALTVLNHCPNLQKVVEIPPQACGIEGSSVYLRAGEHLTVRELLLGLMLRSGNDCATALALEVGGSVENFAQMMNETVQNLGCMETHLENPHGLHNENHFTTASDLAKITCAAFANQDFAEIVQTKSATISNEGMEYDRVLANKNKLLSMCDGADGVKTGYTQKAGRCFVGSATRNGMQVVVVVLNCGPMFEETAALLDCAFARYTMKTIIPQNKLCGVVYRKGKPTYYCCKQAFCYPLAPWERPTIKITVDDTYQKAEVFLDGTCLHTQQLAAE